MKTFLVIGLTALTLTFTQVPRVCAQESVLSLDATLGGGHAFGGGQMNVRGFATLDALLAVGRRHPSVSSTVYGLALNLQGRTGYGDDCVVPHPFSGPCLKDFPNLVSVGVLAGRSYGLPLSSSVAVLAGAGAYFAEGTNNALGFREHGPTALELQARIDAASAVKAHMAFLVSLRGALLPNLRGDSYRLLGLGVGVRLQ